MLGLVLDAAALSVIVAIVNQGEEINFFKAALVAIGISVACGLAGVAFAKSGFAIQLLGLVPMAALAGLVIWVTLGMTMQRSMISGAVFLAYKIALAFILASDLSS